MQLRYLAFVWDSADTEASATAACLERGLGNGASTWTSLLKQPGLSVLLGPRPFHCYGAHVLGNCAGVVLGVLFDRRQPHRSSAKCSPPFFKETEAANILHSGGRRLVENYWGRYVAFLTEPSGPRKRTLRDPIGDIPCYRAKIPGVDVYFSSVSDLMGLRAIQPTVNWEHLRARVITGNAWADESALNEIETLHPGECITHNAGRISREYYWHPFDVARQRAIEDPDSAAAELRETTRTCAAAWASLHDSAIHVLSGGLDSSIVASCLASAPSRPRVTCLNFRTVDPDSDERLYARLTAARAGFELVEIERHTKPALQRIFDCQPTAGPLSLVMRGLEVQPLISDVAQSREATAVFSGDGGDAIFFRGWPQLAVIDYAHHRGLNRNLVKHALGAALPAQLSVWRLLSDALKHGTLRRPWSIHSFVFDHHRLVTDEIVEHARRSLDFLNPWGYPADHLPPGKLVHAFTTTRPSLFRDPLPESAPLDFINPLICQPVLELCLRVPTWLHAAYGKDRAVARAAFAFDLPAEIIHRTWKGAADRRLHELLANNLALVRRQLLEGQLLKAGILDRKRLTDTLSMAPSRGDTHATEVFAYFCTEAWLQHWAAPHASGDLQGNGSTGRQQPPDRRGVG